MKEDDKALEHYNNAIVYEKDWYSKAMEVIWSRLPESESVTLHGTIKVVPCKDITKFRCYQQQIWG